MPPEHPAGDRVEPAQQIGIARVGRGDQRGVKRPVGAERARLIQSLPEGRMLAVSLGADAPRVEHGTERFLLDADGQTVFA